MCEVCEVCEKCEVCATGATCKVSRAEYGCVSMGAHSCHMSHVSKLKDAVLCCPAAGCYKETLGRPGFMCVTSAVAYRYTLLTLHPKYPRSKA